MNFIFLLQFFAPFQSSFYVLLILTLLWCFSQVGFFFHNFQKFKKKLIISSFLQYFCSYSVILLLVMTSYSIIFSLCLLRSEENKVFSLQFFSVLCSFPSRGRLLADFYFSMNFWGSWRYLREIRPSAAL